MTVSWASKLQKHKAISITEAEYIAMSSSLRDMILIMDLVAKIMNHNFQVPYTAVLLFCKVWKDDEGALEVAWLPKIQLDTKYISICYHHFC